MVESWFCGCSWVFKKGSVYRETLEYNPDISSTKKAAREKLNAKQRLHVA